MEFFSVKSMYNKLNEKTVNHYNLGQPDSFWKKLWSLDISDRIKIFAWKCLQNALSTNLKLSKFMEDVHPYCSFGCSEEESIEHILIFCPYAKVVWASEPNPVAQCFHSSITLIDICKQWMGKLNPTISIELILTKAWFIWKERCNRVFEKTKQSSGQLSLEIQRYLDFWSNHSNTQVKNKDLISSTWSPPRKNQLKINVDATSNSKSLPAGFSLILRNDGGEFEQSRAGPTSASTDEEAEAIGMRQGAKWEVEHGLANFLVEGDCKNLIDYLNGKESGIEWQNQAIMEEVKREFNLCQKKLGFFYVPRAANNAANILAKEAKYFRQNLNWSKSPPSCIKNALEVDKSNIKMDISNPILDGSTYHDVRITNSLS
ncbi:uncharacterized protein LOC113329849 [Papaver somniferum]|uniref:uncharacterized protein LOC113329849 n=1 Tax=Papaver somniferum TaxID=3469 RepID=UPI000E70022E|nr:uncharacterized protein LOC113329849 [Papaver somniferum]